jgi:lipopolysaccharide/colanic/teichoic acid biosynthesis glycosyltransferase
MSFPTPSLASRNVAPSRHSAQVRPNHAQEVPVYFRSKGVWIRLLAGLLLVVFCPIILLTALLVRLTSPGPALFRQTRLGKDGRLFDVLKIRTMYHDAEKLSGPALCLPGDSRITPIGRLLRFLHLDELPQLINVLRGEMCLVGPRPERPEIIARHKLREIVPGFDERTKVLPGVTGLAQINLQSDQTAECVIRKVQLDLEYIASANASMDLRILLCTAMRMVGIRHGRAARLLSLQRSAAASCGPTSVDAEKRMYGRAKVLVNKHPRRQAVVPSALAGVSSYGDQETCTQPFALTISDCDGDDPVELESPAERTPTASTPRKPH